MFSYLRQLWLSSFNPEKRRRELEEHLEVERNYIDALLAEEQKRDEENAKNGAKNYLSYVNKAAEKTINPTECSKCVGTVTSFNGNHGFIDENIFFDLKVVERYCNVLKVGMQVNYLLYKNPRTEHLEVIKIESVNERCWDDEDDTAFFETQEDGGPEYFETSQRNIVGIVIKQHNKHSYQIETEQKAVDIDLNVIKCDFVPQEGDRVYLSCRIQNDTGYVDRQGEILEVLAMFPTRTLTNEKYTVNKVNDDWAILNEDVLLPFNIEAKSKSGIISLNVGDTVIADVIECERHNFHWRCISYYLKGHVNQLTNNENRMNKKNNSNHAIHVSADQHCVFDGLEQKQIVEFTLSNNAGRAMKAKAITIANIERAKSLISLVNKTLEIGFEIAVGEILKISFEVTSKFYGESCEYFFIDFPTFRIKRSISLKVCEDAATAEMLRANNVRVPENLEPYTTGSRNNRSRYYANKVWSNKQEVIPGVSLFPKRRFVAHRIHGYDVPSRLRENCLTNDRREDVLRNVEHFYPFITEPLTFENYVKHFQLLLHLEEIEQFVNFRRYDRERASFRHEGEFLSLVVEGLAEQRPSLVVGHIVRAINPFNENSPSYEGIIHRVLGDKILIKFNAAFHGMYRNEDYRLEFFFSRFNFRKSHYATERVAKHLGEKFLFPRAICERNTPQVNIELNANDELHMNGVKLKWFNTKLNSVQKYAVYNILRGEVFNMPYVIFGPPGTGKTVTIVEAILQLLKHVKSSRLLVGASSNSGANLIATRLIESGVVHPGDFVRLVAINLIEQNLIPEHLMPYCATIDIGIDGTCKNEMTVTESGLKLRCQMKYLGEHRITIGTCVTLGNYLQLNFASNHFSHVLIDEAGQCTEPETMAAVTQVWKARGQVVLAGDPKQLQPVVISRYAKDYGLSTSFLERIIQCKPYRKDLMLFPKNCGYDPRLLTKLIYSYRALPSILKIYSDFFYDSELLPVIDPHNSREADILKQLTPAVLRESNSRPIAHGTFFFGVRSENKQGKDSPSWYNMLEARNVFAYVIKLYRQKISPQNIGVITPYLGQVKYLRNMFLTAEVEAPKIGTVEEFQGQERDIIIVSTVRSSSSNLANDLKYALGFVRCEKRMNVAISRARSLQVIFGNPHLLCIDPYWQRFIDYCIKNDAYDGCNLPENFGTCNSNNEDAD